MEIGLSGGAPAQAGAAGAWANPERVRGSAYPAVVLTSRSEIEKLEASARRLASDGAHPHAPGFFLASLSRGWRPRVVVVDCGGATGIVYAKERCLAGVPLGVIWADNTLGNAVIAESANREQVLSAAIQRLFARRGVRGLRLVVPSEGFEMRAVDRAVESSRLEKTTSVFERHARLPLAPTYEEFLNRLGHRTRKNCRYYTRRSEAAGHVFVEQLSMAEMREAARQLRPKCGAPTSEGGVGRALNWVEGIESPMAVGLKDANGRWLSFAGGWYGPGAATLCVQLNNDIELEDYSLSLVLRARLIEMLIRRGIGELWFWTGLTRPFSRYAEFIPTTGVYLDVPGLFWRVVRSIAARVGPKLPRPIARDIEWIAKPTSVCAASEPAADD